MTMICQEEREHTGESGGDQKKKGQGKKRIEAGKTPQEERSQEVLTVELVGIKNLKTTHNWRLEFDVFEIDSDKVKYLMDKLNKALVMALVDYE